MTIVGIAMVIVSAVGVLLLNESDFVFSKLRIILWVIVPLIFLISLLIIPASVALLFRYKGPVIELNSYHFITQIPLLGKLNLPWTEIENIGLYGTGKNQSLVLTLRHPEKYIPELSPLQKSTVNLRTEKMGSPYVISLRFLDKPADEIYETSAEFWKTFRPKTE